MLAYRVGEVANNDTLSAELPQSISNALLAEAEIQEGQHRFRCRRQSIASPEFAPPPRQEPAYFTAYEADATFFRGKLNISKADPGRLTAPVVRPGAANPQSSPQQSPPQPPLPQPSQLKRTDANR
jgi:hypothetical protein